MKTRALVCVGLLLAALCASGCSWRPWARSEGPRPDRSRGVELVDADAVVGFLERADASDAAVVDEQVGLLIDALGRADDAAASDKKLRHGRTLP